MPAVAHPHQELTCGKDLRAKRNVIAVRFSCYCNHTTVQDPRSDVQWIDPSRRDSAPNHAPPAVQVEPVTTIDVMGKTADQVADEIIVALGAEATTGCVGPGRGCVVGSNPPPPLPFCYGPATIYARTPLSSLSMAMGFARYWGKEPSRECTPT